MDAMVVSRILPLTAIFIFLCTFSSWNDFHWQIAVLGDVLLLIACCSFWLHRDRRASMPKVLLRSRFWRRLWNHCALPVLLSSFIIVLTESSDTWATHALWHVLLSILALSIIHIVH